MSAVPAFELPMSKPTKTKTSPGSSTQPDGGSFSNSEDEDEELGVFALDEGASEEEVDKSASSFAMLGLAEDFADPVPEKHSEVDFQLGASPMLMSALEHVISEAKYKLNRNSVVELPATVSFEHLNCVGRETQVVCPSHGGAKCRGTLK
eukprot:CAMPEP_0194504280 /NCGR_PEP_ID=MMETSP0253-20130528/28856_1 /TAXON_ID=2966 /ORGANISM="Noctiluca scintillans" /LENGTH=149 /DNA_ID=CAMNT_0039346653 /DNA_START=172 /DNA_END=619 /DNA_ORIENTATION=-